MLTHARDIMKWCEDQPEVDYVLAMATNSQLRLRASEVIAKAQADYEQRCQPVTALMETLFDPSEELDEAGKLVRDATWYRSLCYKTQNSWSCSRRVVTKVSYGSSGNQVRYVVTSLPADKYPPSIVYTKQYCPRGEMENRLKEQQLELYGTTALLPKHLRAINSDFGYLQLLTSSCKLFVNIVWLKPLWPKLR